MGAAGHVEDVRAELESGGGVKRASSGMRLQGVLARARRKHGVRDSEARIP